MKFHEITGLRTELNRMISNSRHTEVQTLLIQAIQLITNAIVYLSTVNAGRDSSHINIDVARGWTGCTCTPRAEKK